MSDGPSDDMPANSGTSCTSSDARARASTSMEPEIEDYIISVYGGCTPACSPCSTNLTIAPQTYTRAGRPKKERHGGNFERRMEPPFENLKMEDMENPWNFYGFLMMVKPAEVVKFLQRYKLLIDRMHCDKPGCSGIMTMQSRKNKLDGVSLRCSFHR